jgi:hypothetical protein
MGLRVETCIIGEYRECGVLRNIKEHFTLFKKRGAYQEGVYMEEMLSIQVYFVKLQTSFVHIMIF